MAAAAGAMGSPSKAQTKEEKKEKAKKKVMKDANGNELKRPLSAYMLYNNHRRPTLRAEHPGKQATPQNGCLYACLTDKIHHMCRAVPARPLQVDW